jgi:predicted unusual protein kinase regulating ubiquinone biosynthesis (AarF/ABC1/UbiB family)
LRELLASFGFQILDLGVCHSDPHPGNILLRDFRDIALIDFGQVKILSDETRVLFAHLVVSLYEESDQLYAILKTLKVEFTINDPKLIRTIASILFDTRMDIPEALVSPLDSEFPAELRSVRINVIPTEVFMIIRIIAIFRGIFSALDIDLHARKLWVSSARQTILDSERVYNFNILATPRNEVNIVDQLKHFSAWLALHGLPHQREYMMAFAKLHVFCIKDLRKLAAENERSALDAVFANFSEQDRSRCLKLCYEHS